MMFDFDDKYPCEHCGTKVKVAKVCPACGRDHDHSWYVTNTENDSDANTYGFLGMIFFIPFLFYKESTVTVPNYLPFLAKIEYEIFNIWLPSVGFATIMMVVCMIVFGFFSKKA